MPTHPRAIFALKALKENWINLIVSPTWPNLGKSTATKETFARDFPGRLGTVALILT